MSKQQNKGFFKVTQLTVAAAGAELARGTGDNATDLRCKQKGERGPALAAFFLTSSAFRTSQDTDTSPPVTRPVDNKLERTKLRNNEKQSPHASTEHRTTAAAAAAAGPLRPSAHGNSRRQEVCSKALEDLVHRSSIQKATRERKRKENLDAPAGGLRLTDQQQLQQRQQQEQQHHQQQQQQQQQQDDLPTDVCGGEGEAYVNDALEGLLFDELQSYSGARGFSGFIPALKQVANVATLPGIAVVSPGGVGFDINCGVRLLRTCLMEADVKDKQEQLAQALFDYIPVGVGSQGIIPCKMPDLESALELGTDWLLRQGYAWTEDKEHCEEYGRMLTADASKVSIRAKKRGLPQMGTLGAGNHYCEVQVVVEEIYDELGARKMGLEKGQVCVMVHSGSRGLGHQGQDYLAAMAAAANFAWVNRGAVSFLAREAFAKVLQMSPDDLDMHVVYDVSHNIAKQEQHFADGCVRSLLVHRKGATRALPPHHPSIPCAYQLVGQPVLIGGTMGTNSYVLLGTEKGLQNTWASTCHGAGRAKSRNNSRNTLSFETVIKQLEEKHISLRVASPKLVTEEAPESYKDVTAVVDTCHAAGISKKTQTDGWRGPHSSSRSRNRESPPTAAAAATEQQPRAALTAAAAESREVGEQQQQQRKPRSQLEQQRQLQQQLGAKPRRAAAAVEMEGLATATASATGESRDADRQLRISQL
ncbi:hypothetical protein Esti_000182 [Eimeria stiedai]